MAHEMTQDDQMYSVRIAPWHIGQGTNVIMLDTAPERRMERMQLAGQDWTVQEQELYRKVAGRDWADDRFVAVEGSKLLTRSDTDKLLSVQADTYAVVQNVTGHELFEALAGDARLDDQTGGTTHSGARCYLSARLDEPAQITGDTSPIYPYVVIVWSHDGSGAVQARMVSVRPVCWNTVSAGELEARRSGRNFTFRHTKNVADRIDDARAVITGAREATSEFVELANELAEIAVSDETREAFVERFIPAPVTTNVISDRVLDNINEARGKVRSIFDSPTIPEAHRNTAYGLVTAGVEYLDHLRGYRSSDTYLGRTLLRDEPLKAKLVPMVRELVAEAS